MLLSNADGTYSDRSSTLPQAPAVDFNGDGWEDFYTSGLSGAGSYPFYWLNNKNGTLTAIAPDSNHRIASNLAAMQEVVMRGWIGEGVVMCAPQ